MTRFAAAALLVFTAGLIHRSRDLAWGGSDHPDGTRYKVSPLGVSHVLEPHQTVSRTVSCRWGEPAAGTLCAPVPNAPGAWRLLRLVDPLLWLGALVALAGAGAVSRAAWTQVTRAFAAIAIAMALAAPALLAFSVPRASQRLQPLEFGVGGTLGTLQLGVAAALLGGLIIGLRPRRPPSAAGRVLDGAALIAPLFLFVLLFPMPAGLGFFLPGAGLGMLGGRWVTVRQDGDSAVA